MDTRPDDNEAARSGKPPESFRWLPVSRVKRAVLAVCALAFTGLVFCAYLAPGMVFDLANMVFCG